MHILFSDLSFVDILIIFAEISWITSNQYEIDFCLEVSKTKSWAYYFCSVQQLFSLLLKSFDYSADRSFDLRAQPRSRPPVLNKIKINSWNYKFSKKLVKTCEGNWFISLPTKLIQLRWRRKAVKILSQILKSNRVGECFRRVTLSWASAGPNFLKWRFILIILKLNQVWLFTVFKLKAKMTFEETFSPAKYLRKLQEI